LQSARNEKSDKKFDPYRAVPFLSALVFMAPHPNCTALEHLRLNTRADRLAAADGESLPSLRQFIGYFVLL